MAAYSYSAFDANGVKKKGYLSAQSEREARKLIKELNLTPLEVKLSSSKIVNKSKVKNKDIVIMTRQLSTLLDASTSIDDSLKITADQSNNKDLSNCELENKLVILFKVPDMFEASIPASISLVTG